uniref:hypothetical protein n=1 Tax=Phymatolithon calcareum TaxID=1277942 RepID=UPI0023F49AF7|nr:hypothetical protein P6G74_pgp044 [Phymatolithon calcareum]WEA76916.1 hypothetical protein [Phymatolithon calcareum]
MIIKKHHIKFYNINMNYAYYRLKNFSLEWQLILLSDGSFTQNLNSIKGQKIRINLIQQNLIKNNQILRQVWIEDLHKNKIAFAESSWEKNNIKKSKPNNYRPIGKSMIKYELDISKKIHNINYGYNYFTEKAFKLKQPILSREYTICYNKQNLTTIKEFFSPDLKSILKKIT